MEYLGIIFGIIIAIIVIVSWLKNLDPEGNSSLEKLVKNGLANVLGEQNSSGNASEVKIYDENGNVMNFQNNTVPQKDTQNTIIYDEVGNVMSAAVPPLSQEEPIIMKKAAKRAEVVIDEEEEHASMYHDFIRSNGGSSIVIQEILGKPAALRE